jgi:hypothetical protein
MRKIVIALAALEILLVVGLASGELALIPAARNPAVEPAEGNWNDTYEYSVELRFNDAISIELWIWDPVMGDFCPQGTAVYRDIGNWTRIYWHVSPFSGSAGYAGHDSKFKFRWNGTDLKERAEGILRPLIGEGPGIKVIVTPPLPPTVQIFKNATVKPASGLWNDSFEYSVYVNLSEEASIQLEVFDIGSNTWKEAGSELYTNITKWQQLIWYAIPFSINSTGLAKFRFVELTDDYESEIYYGPLLNVTGKQGPPGPPGPPGIGGNGGSDFLKVLERDETKRKKVAALISPYITPTVGKPPQLIKHNVTPTSGSWCDKYNYSVDIEYSNKADMWLTLQIYCPAKNETHIISSQSGKYIEKDLFAWGDISGSDNKTPLKVLREEFDIDWIENAEINITDSKIINISKDDHFAKLIMGEKKKTATLEINDGKTYNLKIKQENDKLNIYIQKIVIDWPNVSVFSQEDAIASIKANESPQYYIRYNDGYNNGLWELDFNLTLTNSPPNLSAPTVFPLEGMYQDIFVYTVDVKDEDGDDVWVTLHIVDSKGGGIYNKTHVVSGLESKIGMTELWIYNFTAKNENKNKNLSFFFTATDGIDEAEKVEGKGPSIKLGLRGWVQTLLERLSLLIIVALAIVAIVSYIVIKRRHGSIRAWLRYIIVKRQIEEKIV